LNGGFLCFKEEAMPARTTRQQARQRAIAAFMSSLDRIIPADESVPLKGSIFRDWEDQITQMREAVLPTVLEERAALEDNAIVNSGGHCPHCGSDSIYLERQTTRPEVLSPDGPLVLERQHGRCRSCGGSFSPSGARLVPTGRSEPDAKGGRTRGA
jgi:hypothetical protein